MNYQLEEFISTHFKMQINGDKKMIEGSTVSRQIQIEKRKICTYEWTELNLMWVFHSMYDTSSAFLYVLGMNAL